MSEQEDFEFRLRFEQEQASPEKLTLGTLPPEQPLEKSPIPIFNQARESGLVKGYLDPAEGANQLIQHTLPPSLSNPAVKEMMDTRIKREEDVYQKNRVKQGDEGFDWTRMVGQMTSPTTVAAGGVKLPATLGKKVLQSIPMAATFGAIQPVTGDNFAAEKGLQIGASAALAPLFPLLIAGGKWSSTKISDAFRNKDSVAFRELSKDINELLGKSKGKVEDALLNYKTRISKPNSPQAIAQSIRETNKTGVADEYGGWVAKLHKEVSRHPSVGDRLKTTLSQQELNRGKVVGAIAGTDDQLADKVSARASNALKNYGKAYDKQIRANPELAQIFDDPFVAKANAAAQDTARSLGIDPKANLTEYLHVVKVAMDKMLDKNAEKPLDSMGKKAVMGAKTKLVGWLKKKNPLYDEARSAYSKESVPINRMKVGKVVEDALVNVREGESPNTYLGAMKNAPRTIKKGGGSRFQTMKEVYPASTIKKLKSVGEELLDQQKVTKMVSGTNSPLEALLAKETIQAPKILKREVVIFNHIMSKLSKGKNPEYQKVLGDMLDNPDELLRALKSTDGIKTQVAKDIMQQMSIIGASQQTSGNIGRVNK